MIRILFFAQAKMLAGQSSLSLSATDAPNMTRLWENLLIRFPQLSSIRSASRVARNGAFAGAEECFVDGDEIAIIPPVSGG